MLRQNLKLKLFFLAIIFCGVFGVVEKTFAATYYVDYENGSDTNEGISTNTAWKHCPGDVNASQSPAIALQPGDEIIFKGGVVYYGTININWAGSSEQQRIVYDGNSAENWGVGKAIIDGENMRYRGFYATSGGRNYVTISNFEIRNMAVDPSASWTSSGIRFNGSSVGVRIEKGYFHDIGHWANDDSGSVVGNGVSLTYPQDCKISENEITKAGGSGIGILGGVGCEISENNIHHYVNWGIDIASVGITAARDNIIRNNTIHDLFQYDCGYWAGQCGTEPHQDFIFVRKGDSLRPSGNVIENNLFYNNEIFDESGGTAMIFLSFADDTIIRNNVFINPHSYYAISPGWESAGTKIYNNTVYAPRATPIRISTSGIKTTEIKNNILVSAGTCIAINNDNSFNSLVSDFNYCYKSSSQYFAAQADPYKSWTFNEWQAFGLDLNTSIASSVEEISFVDTAGYPLSCELMDLRLSQSSPAIGAGVSLEGFSADKDNTSRPQGATWDIGAYEYVESGDTTAPESPSGLSVY